MACRECRIRDETYAHEAAEWDAEYRRLTARVKELEAKLAEANHECYVRRAKIAALKQTAADLCAEADADKESAAGEVKA